MNELLMLSYITSGIFLFYRRCDKIFSTKSFTIFIEVTECYLGFDMRFYY